MKVLVTGASGFVGSHIVDALRAQAVDTTVLLRPTSDRTFLSQHLPHLDIRNGSITDPSSLPAALQGTTHVIHCAGCTRARRPAEFDQVNHQGTRNLVEAVNAQGATERFVHISSLAVAGPATAAKPAREDDPPRPISEYGRSKLAAELFVREHCRPPFSVLRPPAVYGPRDYGFLPMFEAVQNHILPSPGRTQMLSLVFVNDLAEAVVAALQHPKAAGKTYFVAAREIITARQMAQEIAVQMKRWTIPCPLPALVLWPICLAQELFSRLTGRPTLLNLQKFAELSAPGWVCDSSRFLADTDYQCPTGISAGVAKSLRWYREFNWLRPG